jgi:hypothetical protein
MITYTVTTEVAPSLVERYTRYMRETHIAEVLATGCFTAADFKQSSLTRFQASYTATAQSDLDRYLTERAPALRADLAKHFPTGLTLARDVWTAVQHWEHP